MWLLMHGWLALSNCCLFFFTCWDVSSHSCIVWCRHLISALGKMGCSSTTTTPLIKEPLLNNVVNQGGSSLGNYYVLAFHGSWADFFWGGLSYPFFLIGHECALLLLHFDYTTWIICLLYPVWTPCFPPCYATFKGGAAGFCNIFSLYFISCVA